jgi:hypothetical protein
MSTYLICVIFNLVFLAGMVVVQSIIRRRLLPDTNFWTGYGWAGDALVLVLWVPVIAGCFLGQYWTALVAFGVVSNLVWHKVIWPKLFPKPEQAT